MRRCVGQEDRRRLLAQVVGISSTAEDNVLERRLLRWLMDENSGDLVGALLNEVSSVDPLPRKQMESPLRMRWWPSAGTRGGGRPPLPC